MNASTSKPQRDMPSGMSDAKDSLDDRRLELLIDIIKNLGFAFDNFPDYRTIRYEAVTRLVREGGYNKLVDLTCVYDTVTHEFTDTRPKIKSNTTLTDEQAKHFAKKANDYLKGVPYKYQVLLRIPSQLNLSSQISKQIKIITIDDASYDKYRQANGINDNSESENGKGLAGLSASLRALSGDALKIPSHNNSYLALNIAGNAQGQNLTVFEADPIYIFKVLFALSYATGNLEKRTKSLGDIYGAPNFFGVGVYDRNLKLVTEIARPLDEAKLVSAYTLKKDRESIDNLIAIFKALVIEQGDKSVEKLRLQIINSLFWYFEMLKTENYNLKTVFSTSVFDSFFATGQPKEYKALVISHDTTKSIQQEELIREHIVELYDERNKIIHSEIALFDYRVDGKERTDIARARVDIAIPQTYNYFLTSCIHRFFKSLPNS